jgi:hypothetical protein
MAGEMQPVSVISHFHVEFGHESEFVDLIKKFDTPLFQQLMADGTVLAWGVSTPALH